MPRSTSTSFCILRYAATTTAFITSSNKLSDTSPTLQIKTALTTEFISSPALLSSCILILKESLTVTWFKKASSKTLKSLFLFISKRLTRQTPIIPSKTLLQTITTWWIGSLAERTSSMLINTSSLSFCWLAESLLSKWTSHLLALCTVQVALTPTETVCLRTLTTTCLLSLAEAKLTWSRSPTLSISSAWTKATEKRLPTMPTSTPL